MTDSAATDIQFNAKSPQDVIQQALATVRRHLQMDIAYLSEFVDGEAVFRAIESGDQPLPLSVGDRMSCDDIYCKYVIDGTLPRLIPDTSAEPLAMDLPVTTSIPIGSHVSIPIRRDDGSLYGTFCCLGHAPNPTLNDRDLAVMETFASLAEGQVNTAVRRQTREAEIVDRIRDVIAAQRFTTRLQPIFTLSKGKVTGFEALCRFSEEPYRSPDKWFAEAAEANLAIDLELAVMRTQLDLLDELPDDVYISVNAAPETVASGRLDGVLTGRPLERIVLEITEHVAVADYEALVAEIQKWRFRGLTLAIDDAGAGYAGFQHIVRLSPDILKLDISLTSGMDTNPAKRSLAAALVHYADEVNALIVAEGIETEAERATLEGLGVHRGQGWLLGRPEVLEDAKARLDDDEPASLIFDDAPAARSAS